MINLTKPLPDTLSVSGMAFAIDTHFSTWIRFGQLMQEGYEFLDMVFFARRMVFQEGAEPSINKIEDIDELFSGLIWFFNGGMTSEEMKAKASRGKKSKYRAYDYIEDAALIAAAFMQAYGVDVFNAPGLHWWVFLAYMDGIPEETVLSKVIGYRTAETSKMPAEMKKHYEEMRARFTLDNPSMSSGGDIVERARQIGEAKRRAKEQAENGET